MGKSNVFIQVSDHKVESVSVRSYRIGDRVTVVEFAGPTNGKVMGTGVSVRNPMDEDNEELGWTIAFERAAFDMYRKVRKVRTRMQHAHD